MALKEYAITYTFTGQETTSNENRTVNRSRFALSGATSVNIGKITRIDFTRTHRANGTSTWTIGADLVVSSSKTLKATDTRVNLGGGSAVVVTNTFTNPNMSVSEATTWTSIATTATRETSSTTYLKWEATSSHPMTVTIYFWRKEDMCEGATKPTIGNSSNSDETGLYSTYGGYVCGFSNPIISYDVGLDWEHFDYITAVANASVKIGNTVTNYSTDIDINNRVAVVQIGTLPQSSTQLSVSVTLTVTDLAGNTTTKRETITAFPYTVPILTVQARRAVYNIASLQYEPNGTGTALQLRASVANYIRVNGISNYRIKFEYKEMSATSYKSAITVASGKTSDFVYDDFTSGNAVLDGNSSTALSAAMNYSYRVTVTDGISTVVFNGTISAGNAIFNIEAGGVSVGTMSHGTRFNPLFECNYPAIFTAGVEGVLAVKGGQTSTYTISTSSSVIEVPIDFGYTFRTEPFVSLTMISTSGVNLIGRISAILTSVTKSGAIAQICGYTGTSSPVSVALNWVAIENTYQDILNCKKIDTIIVNDFEQMTAQEVEE